MEDKCEKSPTKEHEFICVGDEWFNATCKYCGKSEQSILEISK
jgi:hypothetical protein